MDESAKKWIAVGCLVSLLAVCCVCGGLVAAFGGVGMLQFEEVKARQSTAERFFAAVRAKDFASARALTSERFQHAHDAASVGAAVEAAPALAAHTRVEFNSYYSADTSEIVGGVLTTPTGTSGFELAFVRAKERWVIDEIRIDGVPIR